jgi:multidrug efflux pump subunit AcrA (membrane-fusion protein)
VRVFARFPEEERAIVVPQRAVLDEQGGSYVLVVAADDSVERRPVRPGRMVAGRQEILSGLEGGERVIVDGLQGLRPGVKVQPEAVAKEGEAPPAAEESRPADRP